MKKALLFTLLLTPLFTLLYQLFAAGAEEPVKEIYKITGAAALTLLYATTTLSMIRKKINLLAYRRMVGLFAFFYALLHMLNFLLLDMELDIGEALNETLQKPFIYLGMTAFLILLFMAVTSARALFAQYYRYHKVIYLALLLGTVHFVMAQKALEIDQWGYLGVMAGIGLFKVLQRTKVLKL